MVREHHCCGCPNHVCNPKNEKGVKIEEHEPLDSAKNGENYLESLVPANWGNYPYPIVWIPPENNKNKEQGTTKPRIIDLETASEDKKPAVSSLHKEPGWNSWFPLFMGDYEDHSKPGGEKRRSDNQDVCDNERSYPFPVIWIPPYGKQEEAGANKKQQANTQESPGSNLKMFPMQLNSNHNRTSEGGPQINYRNEVGSHHQDAEKNIDVKEPCVGKNNSRDSQEEATKALSKRSIDTPVDRVPGFNARKSSSSLTKTSKLPPVCLRVDPLPRKNGPNGSSKSPRSQGFEMKSCISSEAPSTGSNEQNSHNQSMNRNSEEHLKRREVKVIEVKGETPSSSDNNSGDLQSSLQVEHPEKIKDSEDPSEKEEVCEIKEGKGATIAGDKGIEKRSEELQASKTLSDEEAAMRIQSAYRGFQVRKWETLKKLRQMAKVHDEVTKVRRSIEELASSKDTLPDQGKHERQKVLIGESIMNLLLRLDTIQGLLPNLRDIRKSLARELVALQEELDSLTTKSLEECVDDSSTARDVESKVSEKEHDAEAKRQFEESLSVSENVGGQLELEEAQLLEAENLVSQPSECVCSGTIDDQTQVAFEDLKSETSASLDAESQQAALRHRTVRHLNEIDDAEPPVVSIMEPTETKPKCPAGVKDERAELDTAEKSNYDSGDDDEIRLASNLGDGSSTKMEFMSTDQVASALQALPQADEEKGTMAFDGAGVEPATFTGPTSCTGDDDSIYHRREPAAEVASKIHIAEEDVADSVLSKDGKFGIVDSVLNGHGKCDEGSDAITSSENCGKLTIEAPQLEVPKAMTSDSEVVDNVHLEQLVAPVPDDLSPGGSLKHEECSQDASNGVEGDQRHGEGNSDEALLPPRPEEARPGVLGSMVETSRDVNEDKAIVSADLSCNCSDMLNGEALAREKEELIAESVGSVDLMTQVGVEVDEQEDNHEEEVIVAPRRSTLDEGAEQVEQSPPGLDESNARRPVEGMDGKEKPIEENEKLREMMEKLMEAGKEQLNVISELTGKVKDLERRLARDRRTKPRCRAAAAKPRTSHAKSCADSVN